MAEVIADAAATELELDLTLVAPVDRNLRLTVSYRLVNDAGVEEVGQIVANEIKRFPIRGSLPIPTMTALLRLETRINNALGADDAKADQELELVMTAAHSRIVEIVTEKSPEAFLPTELEIAGVARTVMPVIELDTSQILVVLAWLAGDISVADSVARALTAGRSAAQTEEELDEAAERAGGAGSAEEAEASAPLPSSAR